MDVNSQILSGALVSPKTHKQLYFSVEKNVVKTQDGTESFEVINGVPFFNGPNADQRFRNEQMDKEYRESQNGTRFFSKFKKVIYNDLINKKCINIMKKFDAFSNDDVILGVGGGPVREHPLITNLNISNYPNVDVVADAHHLPYADNSVDAIHVSAVLEHLYDPLQAISEMYRVLKKDGIVFSLTPFMQAYHGYPHHYQNLTLTGHEYYFSSKGFKILDSGPAVGPTMALIIINSKYILNYFPPVINKIFGAIFIVFSLIFIKPLDLLLIKSPKAYVLSSTTYVYAKK